MFLGAGGSGKSSLLDGLMNIPLKEAESTALTDTRTVTFQWVAEADGADEAWKEYSSSDETKSIAIKCHHIVAKKRKRMLSVFSSMITERLERIESSSDAVKIFSPSVEAKQYLKESSNNPEYVKEVSEKKDVTYEEIIKAAKGEHDFEKKDRYLEMLMQRKEKKGNSENPDVVMHIWDCGGQPIFLDILAAFLTPRTMFVLLFDSSIDLQGMYKEKWHHKGNVIEGREQYVTHHQLMIQWLQLIHSSLVAKNEGLPWSQSQASPSSLPEYPRAMLVGSRLDLISPEVTESVKSLLESTCSNAAFGDLVVDKLIVDNTKAGKGKEGEDPAYKQIRKNIHNFAKSLLVPTPLAWVAFRQVLQSVSKDDPVLTYGQVSIIAESCSIAKEVIPSVLHFYHQLGAMLHYVNIPSLANTVIVEPQWLINQLRLLLMPAWFGHRPQHLQRLWKWLEEKGVLVEALYQAVWKDCGLEGGPQAIVDLLDHFDLAKEISQYPTDMEFYHGKKYFVPCMLKARPKGVPSGTAQLGEVFVRQAATLHVIFNMGYVPPGFFVRLVAHMTKHKDFTPLLEGVVYRDSIKFRYNEIDCLTITESLESVDINYSRRVLRKKHNIHFALACVSLRERIVHMCDDVLHWLPSIKVQFAFKCSCSDNTAFVKITPEAHQESTLFCKHEKKLEFCKEHKYWLGNIPLQQQNVRVFCNYFLSLICFYLTYSILKMGCLRKKKLRMLPERLRII